MAAVYASLGTDEVKKFDALSQKIEMRFHELQTLLETRKARLLGRVREMKELYQKHREIEKSIEQVRGVVKTTKDFLTENLLAGSKDQVVSFWDDKIKDMRREKDKLGSVCELKFLSNFVEMSANIDRIHLRDCGDIEFLRRREPLVMTGKRGGSEGEIFRPFGIAVDMETDSVFVADFYKHLISVYSLEGEFIKSFGDGTLVGPYGICISEEFVFVTDRNCSSVVKFLRSGKYVCNTKSQNKNLQLDVPSNLCIHNTSLYVCNTGKHRIELFNFDLVFIKSFGESIHFQQDIKIHEDTIFVLNQADNSINKFNAQHEFICPIPLTGPKSAIISNAFFFSIDLNGNFVISDRTNGCLKIFSPAGQYMESLGEGYLTTPQGIAIDRFNRIVSVSDTPLSCLQIY